MLSMLVAPIQEIIVRNVYVFAIGFSTCRYMRPPLLVGYHGLRRNLSFACCPFLQGPCFERASCRIRADHKRMILNVDSTALELILMQNKLEVHETSSSRCNLH
jgi:hypothetical protein